MEGIIINIQGCIPVFITVEALLVINKNRLIIKL